MKTWQRAGGQYFLEVDGSLIRSKFRAYDTFAKPRKDQPRMDDFDKYRAEMNEKLLGSGHLGIKRFFALDTQAYEDGPLDKKTKELMGLTASIVLRCDDCITYHIKQCADAGVTREQFVDAFNVALVVGGSITIPHWRRAVEKLDQVLPG